jgi:hypothetical protein
MDSTKPNTFTDLFHLSKKWHAENPGKQHEQCDWRDELHSDVNGFSNQTIYAGEHRVRNVPMPAIHVFAAVSLGMPSQELAAIIKHHKVRLDHIGDCTFERNDSPPFPPHPDDARHLSIDVWRVTCEVTRAMSQDPELYEVMVADAEGYEDYPDFDIARLLCDNADFWPATSLRRILTTKACGASKVDNIHPGFTDVYSFITTNADFNQFSDEQVMTILERSGHLCLGVTPENGFWFGTDKAFFNNLFLMLDCEEPPRNFTRIVQAINAVADPEKIALIAAKLTEILPHIPYERSDDAMKTLAAMEKHLDQGKYGSLIKNVALRINLMPVDIGTGEISYLDDESVPACFEEIVKNRNTLLKRLSDEIMAIDPLHLQRSHFTALRKAVKATRTTQDITGLNLPRFLKKILRELQALEKMAHYTVIGSKTELFIEEARQDVATLIRFASKQPGIDYRTLQELPSALKAMLASNGFDMRKLPGISRSDKGKVLSDELGL